MSANSQYEQELLILKAYLVPREFLPIPLGFIKKLPAEEAVLLCKLFTCFLEHIKTGDFEYTANRYWFCFTNKEVLSFMNIRERKINKVVERLNEKDLLYKRRLGKPSKNHYSFNTQKLVQYLNDDEKNLKDETKENSRVSPSQKRRTSPSQNSGTDIYNNYNNINSKEFRVHPKKCVQKKRKLLKKGNKGKIVKKGKEKSARERLKEQKENFVPKKTYKMIVPRSKELQVINYWNNQPCLQKTKQFASKKDEALGKQTKKFQEIVKYLRAYFKGTLYSNKSNVPVVYPSHKWPTIEPSVESIFKYIDNHVKRMTDPYTKGNKTFLSSYGRCLRVFLVGSPIVNTSALLLDSIKEPETKHMENQKDKTATKAVVSLYETLTGRKSNSSDDIQFVKLANKVVDFWERSKKREGYFSRYAPSPSEAIRKSFRLSIEANWSNPKNISSSFLASERCWDQYENYLDKNGIKV